ncbi:MAG: hypothetical protein R3C56_00490 [Pirellulaceae bacterium]
MDHFCARIVRLERRQFDEQQEVRGAWKLGSPAETTALRIVVTDQPGIGGRNPLRIERRLAGRGALTSLLQIFTDLAPCWTIRSRLVCHASTIARRTCPKPAAPQRLSGGHESITQKRLTFVGHENTHGQPPPSSICTACI